MIKKFSIKIKMNLIMSKSKNNQSKSKKILKNLKYKKSITKMTTSQSWTLKKEINKTMKLKFSMKIEMTLWNQIKSKEVILNRIFLNNKIMFPSKILRNKLKMFETTIVTNYLIFKYLFKFLI